ncbi:unnamed protein product [Withania somnifera]
MNPREGTENPIEETANLREEIENAIEEDIASSSKIQDRREEIGASSVSLAVNVTSSRRTISLDFCSNPDNFHDNTIIDPVTRDTYFLDKEIGSFYNGHCQVYKARYSKYSQESRTCVPSGYVTLKTMDMNLHESEFCELRHQGTRGIAYRPHANVIGSNRAFGTVLNVFCVSLPYMSEGSLRYILSTRPSKKLPEDLISVVLKVVLLALRDEIHVESNPRVHKTLNAGDIFFHIDDVTGEMLIKLAFEASVYHSENLLNSDRREASSTSLFLNPKSISQWGAAPEVFRSENENNSGPKSDIWLLGITALELAYGNLPVRNRGDLNYIIRKIKEKKKFPKSLEKLLIKSDGKLKKVMDFVKRKKRVFSVEFEEMVLACLDENPEKRPTARQLLDAPFFGTAIERLKKFVLNSKN